MFLGLSLEPILSLLCFSTLTNCLTGSYLLVLCILNRILLKHFVCLRLQVIHEGLNGAEKKVLNPVCVCVLIEVFQHTATFPLLSSSLAQLSLTLLLY